MKKFEFPEIEIMKFNVEDIIAKSVDFLPIAPISDLSSDELDIVSMD